VKIDKRMTLSIICRLPSEFVDMIAEEEGEDTGKNWKLTMSVLSKFRRKFISQKEEIEDLKKQIAQFHTVEKNDVAFIDGHETFFQISEIDDVEGIVDLVGFDENIDDVKIKDITTLFKKYQ